MCKKSAQVARSAVLYDYDSQFIAFMPAARDGSFVILTTTKRLFVGHAGMQDVLLVGLVSIVMFTLLCLFVTDTRFL